MMTERAEGEQEQKEGWGVVALVAVMAAAVAARAWLLWSTPLVPGTNGGYYLIQARALLEHGHLGIPDLPLAFIVQAAMAKLLQCVTGRGLESCILLAVRLCDAVLPPLAAVPIYLLGRTWCRRAGRGVWPAVAAAAMAVFGMPALSMVGDFEKNSLGLVWLAGLTAALHAWMTRRTLGRGAAVVALLGLCGLTHIGVFGAALSLTALTWAADLALLRGKEGLRTLYHIGAVVTAGAAVAALAAGLVVWKFDPVRIRRLAGALSSPVVFLQTGGHAAGPGPDFRAVSARGAADRFGPPQDGGRPESAGVKRPEFTKGDRARFAVVGHGGPRGMRKMPRWVASGLFMLAAAGALVLPWLRRREVSGADRAAAAGCALTLLLLTGPWVRGDIVERLRLIAVIPASFAAVFVVARLPGRWSAPVCAAAILVLTAFMSTLLLRRGGHPAISAEAFVELQALTRYVAQPGHTLVVARHGLEWWTAWALHTHVAQARAVRAADWSKYDTVLFLREKGRGGRGAVGPGGVAMEPPSQGGRDAERSAAVVGAEDGKRPGATGRPSGSGGLGGRGPMMESAIPDDAEILYEGACFCLARVSAPPDSVTRSRAEPQATLQR